MAWSFFRRKGMSVKGDYRLFKAKQPHVIERLGIVQRRVPWLV